MSYRIGEKPAPKPRRRFEKINTPGTIEVDNGSTARVKLPCNYLPIESAKMIKTKEALETIAYNKGVDNPRLKRVHDSSRDIPIHLRQEFSNPQIKVSLDNTLSGISVIEAGIDSYPNDNIIYIIFKVNCPTATTKKQICRFTCRLIHDNMQDVFLNGKLIILPTIL